MFNKTLWFRTYSSTTQNVNAAFVWLKRFIWLDSINREKEIEERMNRDSDERIQNYNEEMEDSYQEAFNYDPGMEWNID